MSPLVKRETKRETERETERETKINTISGSKTVTGPPGPFQKFAPDVVSLLSPFCIFVCLPCASLGREGEREGDKEGDNVN